jgi:hypothetical protein
LEIQEVIFAYGHENVLATHETTFEITKDAYLSERGNCIIAVLADKALTDLSFEFKEGLKRENAKLSILIEVEAVKELINAFGSPNLILSHPKDIVVRKSSYVCSRTLAINADKAAFDLSRKLVEKLRNPKQEVKITLTIKV